MRRRRPVASLRRYIIRDVYVVAIGMIPFGRHPDEGIKDLTSQVMANLVESGPVAVDDLEAAGALNRRVIHHNTVSVPKLEVADSALQLHGGNGLSREYPIEKILRDARASRIEDGTNVVLSLAAAERL